MGLDLSMTGTGVVVWDGNKCQRKRRYKTLPVAPTEGLKVRPRGQQAQDKFIGDEEERIAWLKKKIRMTVRKFSPDLIVIEGHAFGAQGRGKTLLAELHGVVKNMLHEENLLFVTVPPQSIKKHVTGSGKAQKLDVIVAAKAYDQNISDSDTADAWACAKFGYDEYKNLVE